MEKVRPWCGQPSDRGRLRNRTEQMMGWQWHQLHNMQIISTSLQTNNHTSTSSLDFYTPDALPDAQATVTKHLCHIIDEKKWQ